MFDPNFFATVILKLLIYFESYKLCHFINSYFVSLWIELFSVYESKGNIILFCSSDSNYLIFIW